MSDSVERLNTNFGSELLAMNVKIAVLNTKVAVYAALAGGGAGIVFSVIAALIVNFLTKK